jgi:hypothetical protein
MLRNAGKSIFRHTKAAATIIRHSAALKNIKSRFKGSCNARTGSKIFQPYGIENKRIAILRGFHIPGS